MMVFIVLQPKFITGRVILINIDCFGLKSPTQDPSQNTTTAATTTIVSGHFKDLCCFELKQKISNISCFNLP